MVESSEDRDPVVLILHHGADNSPSDWKYVEEQAKQKMEGKTFETIISKVNAKDTNKGIDVCGLRLVTEINEVVKPMIEQGYTPRIYVAGHGIGGLICRYALGYLFDLGVIQQTKLCTFMSICTPHLGLRAPSRKIFRSWMHAVSHITGAADR